jgi:quinol monooxygenase YgiN
MIIGLFLNLLIFGLIIFGIKRVFSKSNRHIQKEGGVRRFFQMGLLFGLAIISAVGVAGLLGRVIPIGTVLNEDRGNLALQSAFTVVGVPLFLIIANWARKSIRQDPEELQTLAWNLYLTGISIISLILVINAQMSIYDGLFKDAEIQGKDLSQLIVWGAIWYFHFTMHRKVEPSTNALGEQLIGSAIGVGFSFIGLLTIFSALISKLFTFSDKTLIISNSDPLTDGLITLAIGAPIWIIYWIKTAKRQFKDSLWYGYVLLVGVGGGLLATLTALSFTLYWILVWFFGDVTATAAVHFSDLTQTIGTSLAAAIVLAYHRQLLQESVESTRSDIRRVYEYVISAIGLAAAAGGVTLILVSIIESLSKTTQISGNSSTNTLIGAFTLIAIGGSVWWIQWRSVQRIVQAQPVVEQGSIIRRVYLLLLFGVVGVTAVIVLLTAAYLVFYDLFQNGINSNTANKVRYPVAIFLTTVVISKYHWDIYKQEKDVEVFQSKSVEVDERLYFFVELKLKPRSATKVIDVLDKYVVYVRKEKGCEKIDVLIDPKVKNTVYLYEIWSNSKTHAAHLSSEGFTGWKAYSDPLITSIEVKQLTSELI